MFRNEHYIISGPIKEIFWVNCYTKKNKVVYGFSMQSRNDAIRLASSNKLIYRIKVIPKIIQNN